MGVSAKTYTFLPAFTKSSSIVLNRSKNSGLAVWRNQRCEMMMTG